MGKIFRYYKQDRIGVCQILLSHQSHTPMSPRILVIKHPLKTMLQQNDQQFSLKGLLLNFFGKLWP